MESVIAKLRAVEERLPPGYAFSGLTAAWLLGLDMPPCQPVEVTIGREVPIRARAGIRLRRAFLPESDVISCQGFPVTSPMRTARDLGSRADIVESVVALDMALHAGLVELSELTRYVESHAGDRGIRRLRRATQLASPLTESPMESRLRVALIRARLPSPLVQVDLHDHDGQFLGRADLYYPDCNLVIEYDGENHKERLTPDARRQNGLVNAGFHVLRFTAADLRVPGLVASQVRRARAHIVRTMPPSAQPKPHIVRTLRDVAFERGPAVGWGP